MAESALVETQPDALPAPESAPAQGNLIILPAVFQQAEEHLAQYVGQHLDPQLAEGMQLTLSNALSKGKTDLKLTFEGPLVAANNALVGTQIVDVLKQHPVFGPLFSRDGKEAPHGQKPPEAHENQVQIHVPGLELAEYTGLIQALAGHMSGLPYRDAAELPSAGQVSEARLEGQVLAQAPAHSLGLGGN